MTFFSSPQVPRGGDIEQHMQFDVIAQRQQWYGAIRRLLADVFGAEAAGRAAPGPDFHGRGMHVPVSLILDGYLFSIEEIPEMEREKGADQYRLMASCSKLHYGIIGLWTNIERPAHLRAALRVFEGWTPDTPESGGVILALPAQSVQDYLEWSSGFLVVPDDGAGGAEDEAVLDAPTEG